jgi:hypothetical protein
VLWTLITSLIDDLLQIMANCPERPLLDVEQLLYDVCGMTVDDPLTLNILLSILDILLQLSFEWRVAMEVELNGHDSSTASRK